mmetsp:Transcript_22986/g.60745  ORF Transcript_22986/g.60745 Transcript_22986/m.60745 type:complete len:330 (+) Transcript_22986:223-1212(+)
MPGGPRGFLASALDPLPWRAERARGGTGGAAFAAAALAQPALTPRGNDRPRRGRGARSCDGPRGAWRRRRHPSAGAKASPRLLRAPLGGRGPRQVHAGLRRHARRAPEERLLLELQRGALGAQLRRGLHGAGLRPGLAPQPLQLQLLPLERGEQSAHRRGVARGVLPGERHGRHHSVHALGIELRVVDSLEDVRAAVLGRVVHAHVVMPPPGHQQLQAPLRPEDHLPPRQPILLLGMLPDTTVGFVEHGYHQAQQDNGCRCREKDIIKCANPSQHSHVLDGRIFRPQRLLPQQHPEHRDYALHETIEVGIGTWHIEQPKPLRETCTTDE